MSQKLCQSSGNPRPSKGTGHPNTELARGPQHGAGPRPAASVKQPHEAVFSLSLNLDLRNLSFLILKNTCSSKMSRLIYNFSLSSNFRFIPLLGVPSFRGGRRWGGRWRVTCVWYLAGAVLVLVWSLLLLCLVMGPWACSNSSPSVCFWGTCGAGGEVGIPTACPPIPAPSPCGSFPTLHCIPLRPGPLGGHCEAVWGPASGRCSRDSRKLPPP